MTTRQWRLLWDLYRKAATRTEVLFSSRVLSQFDSKIAAKLGVLLRPTSTEFSSSEPLSEPSSASRTGTRIAHFEIGDCIGHGGMGEVYSAFDEHLSRNVAIKFLPERALASHEAVERFVLEARTASALNYPSIITIHDFIQESHTLAIVMEYVDGVTARQIVSKHPSRHNDLLEYLRQIAEALAVTHSHDIIHRDLKPENIMIRPDGYIKLLDFGLAELSRKTNVQPSLAAGTLLYMSPEQAQLRRLTPASDIYSLGLIFIELFTGIHPFKSLDELPHTSSTTRRMLDRSLRQIPAPVSALLRQMVTEEPANRLLATQVASGVRLLQRKANSQRRQWLTGGVAGLAAVAAGSMIWWKSVRPLQVSLAVPFVTSAGVKGTPAFSPDGSKVAYSWSHAQNGFSNIYFKPIIEGPEVRLTTGVARDSDPQWSPDGAWIAYHRSSDEQHVELRIVRTTGEDDHLVASTLESPVCMAGGGWSFDGKWVISADQAAPGQGIGLFRFRVSTGAGHAIVAPPQGSEGDCSPSISPDGRYLAFSRVSHFDVSDLFVQPIHPDASPAGSPKRLTSGNQHVSNIAWTPDSRRIIFSIQGHWPMLKVLNCCEAGTPATLPLSVDNADEPTISKRGDLVFVRQQVNVALNHLALDNQGKITSGPDKLLGSSRIDAVPDISPDGKYVAFESDRSGDFEIWKSALNGTNAVQITSLKARSGNPTWSPDQRLLAFSSNWGGSYQVFTVSVDGGIPRQITYGGNNGSPHWSPDSQWIYFESNRNGESLIYRQRPSETKAELVGSRRGPMYGPWPTAQKLYFARGRGSTRKLCWSDLIGASESCQAELIYFSAFSLFTRGRLFVTNPGAQRWDLRVRYENEAASSVLLTSSLAIGQVAVSHDGKQVIFVTVPQLTTDLFIAKLQ